MTRLPRKSDEGFTLIELLVVVVILGILIGMAIPVYLNYRRSASDKAAQSDLRGTVAVLELCQSTNGTYPASINAGTTAGTSGAACTGQTISVSGTTTLTYFPAGDVKTFIVGSTSTSGSGKTYCFHSGRGGGVTTTSTAVTAYRTSC